MYFLINLKTMKNITESTSLKMPNGMLGRVSLVPVNFTDSPNIY